ncbi:hypothetical protein [Pedobacter sp. SG918]|uniref:hypothetical protein n=1 Tax=Pedobacter sp. SG918 TaxID=2587136 RepID=UPI00146C8961|nr:hypothetical protein [Pedobacter sp. SG918]NMN37564.1 hypothetical protein [Pedobacter sp. SG918]
MKKYFPYLFASGVSAAAIISSFTLADPELGISTAFLSWVTCFWIISRDRKNRNCLS